MFKTVGIIGTGSLGENLARMLMGRPNHSLLPVSIIGSVRNDARRQQLISNLGMKQIYNNLDNMSMRLWKNNPEITSESDVVILSVKPFQIENVCREISPFLHKNTPVISAAASVPLKKLHDWLPFNTPIIKCMPNIPCGIGSGVVTYYSKSSQSDKIMTDIFSPNTIISMDSDDEVDISTLISGCGPAFLAWYVECLKKIGEGSISQETLNILISRTMAGTAAMLQNNTAGEIIQAVASHNGSTEKALHTMDANNIDHSIYRALYTARMHVKKGAHKLGK